MKKPKLLPHSFPKPLLFTVDFYCHRSRRMCSPAKRRKHCLVHKETTNDGMAIMFLYNKKGDKLYELVVTSLDIRTDGIWVTGFETNQKTIRHDYQVLALIPEPN